MANVMYASAKEAFLSGDIDMASDDIYAALIDTNEVSFDAGHEFLDDVEAGIIGTPAEVTGKSVTDGVFDSADVTWDDVTGNNAEAVVLYKWTGSAASSRLIMWYDTGVTGLPVDPNTGDITYVVHENGWFGL